MTFVTLDTETVGFFGPIVLLQYGEGDDGPITLWSPMSNPIVDTLQRIEWIIGRKILGFNLAFDIFKLQQAWTTLKLLGKRVGFYERPLDHIDEYALCEPVARDGPCLKPLGAMDLMLHARKGPWQNLMARDPITVRRVPVAIAPLVMRELEERIKIPDIFFAKRKNKQKWQTKEIKNADGVNPDFVNIVLNFAPSSALKALATHELNLDPLETLVYSDVEVNPKFRPVENGFAPFALSVGKPGRWNGAWPDVVKVHHDHWRFNDLARAYATKDIVYPRRLYEKWGRPPFDDVDSLLACLAGSTRWKGFAVNVPGLEKLRASAAVKSKLAPIAARKVMHYLQEVLAPEEQMVLKDQKTGNLTTKKVVLEEIRKLKSCAACLSGEKHDVCKLIEHPAAARASLVLEARSGKKETEVDDKLILAKRFHASVNVIGARSSRNSGGQVTEGKSVRQSGGLNPHGVSKKKIVRQQFPLAFTHSVDEWAELGFALTAEKLVGGDFDKFEVNIAAAYYKDPQLLEDLLGVEPPCVSGECKYSSKKLEPCCPKCTGIPSEPGSVKIHAIIGTLAYQPRTYWEIRATDGKDRDQLRLLFPDWQQEHWANLYTKAKSAFFALIYFGNEDTLADRLGIPKEDGLRVFNLIMARYPVMARERHEFYESFCPVRQPNGAQVFWVEPEDFVSSMNGFKRFFTLENKIIRALYDLAEDVPAEWRDIKVKVKRREKLQTVAGAVRSALYGAAFGLQGANQRAAGNHKIQSTGAIITKDLQAEIWALQPPGIHQWVVRPLNVHDELPTAINPSVEEKVTAIQSRFIQENKKLIPLLSMEWKPMETWAEK